MSKKVNEAGVLLLADDLVAHPEMYEQNEFGEETDCGTVGCLAGHCFICAEGIEAFRAWIVTPGAGDRVLLKAAAKQLGIPQLSQLFERTVDWPSDLYLEYYCAKTPIARVIVALKALERLMPDGSIADETQRHLPQLKKLLEGK